MKAADPRQPDNLGAERRLKCDGPAFGGISKTRVDAIDVVAADVLTEEPAKVVFAQDDDVIDEFALAGAHPSLRRAVLARAGRSSAPLGGSPEPGES